MINNGDRVKDPITGFSGIVTCRLEYLNGCARVQVTSEKLIDGIVISENYFDEPQLVVVKRSIYAVGGQVTGGFKPAPAKRSEDTQ